MILLLENNIRGGISSVMGDRYVNSDKNKKIEYIDAINLYGWTMSDLMLKLNLIKMLIQKIH